MTNEIDWGLSEVYTEFLLKQIKKENQLIETSLMLALERKGIVIDWAVEKARQFKSFKVLEHHNHPNLTQTYLYNDGSIEGLRLLVVEKTWNYDFSNGNSTMYELKINMIKE